jgi:hypothetical protein
VRTFTILFMGALTAAATWVIGPLLLWPALGLAHLVHTQTWPGTSGIIEQFSMPADAPYVLKYSYGAGGQRHEGETYSATGSFGPETAKELMRRLQPGAPVTVYYDPGDPADAVLMRSLTGGDLVMGMIFTSMTAFLGGFWGAFLYLILPNRRPLEAGGQPKSEKGDITRVQAPNFSPWQAAYIGVFFLPFVFAFITIIAGGGMEPQLGLALFFWAMLIAAIAFFPVRIVRRRQRGDFDIVIDKTRSEISLPAMHGRKERLVLPWTEMEAVTLEEGWEGGGRGRKFRSYVYLVTRAGRDTTAMFTGESEYAHAFREWLEHKLGLPATSSPA